MMLYEDSALKKKYACTHKSCDMKLELDTETGKVVQVATGLAVVGGIVLGLCKIFLGGGDNGGGGGSA